MKRHRLYAVFAAVPGMPPLLEKIMPSCVFLLHNAKKAQACTRAFIQEDDVDIRVMDGHGIIEGTIYPSKQHDIWRKAAWLRRCLPRIP